ncbi:unnamed protein product [Vicia faba]|uniref:Pentatricopeptide repeat-containing protein n=1 Tax=Vicia faba TaxID=3906 RepID=A0AAV1A826_VICFA|nr:unnamed protein product [Vicia faba]
MKRLHHHLSFIFMNVPKLNKHQNYGYPLLNNIRIRLTSTATLSLEMKRCNFFISRLCKEGKIDEARKVFDEISERDVCLWTTMISGYIKGGMIKEARKLFDRSDAEKNVIVWTAMVSGYVKMNQVEEAERLFYEMPVRNVVSWNTMIDGYARNGRTEQALDLFRRMPERNVVSWNTIMTALAHSGRIEDAQRLFDKMRERDVVSWTTMVAGLSRNGRIDDARELFDRMPIRNVVSWNAMIAGYAQNGRLDEALKLFERMPQRDMPSWNTMVTGFIQNGELNRAEKLFDAMPQKNIITWTAMMTGYVQHGLSEEALKLFNKMQANDGLKPATGTFVTVLGACSDLAGLIEGQQVHQMISKTVFQESTQVVSALINMYSKCGELHVARKMFDDGLSGHMDLISWNGRLKEAFNIIDGLGKEASLSVWGALLAGCNMHGNTDIGKLVADKVLKIEPENAGTYSLLSNMYASVGKWKEAANVRMKMKDKGLKKQPGCSWIEVGNTVQVFVVGDKSHSQSEDLGYLLLDLHIKMKKAGDMPDDDLLVDVEI